MSMSISVSEVSEYECMNMCMSVCVWMSVYGCCISDVSVSFYECVCMCVTGD